MPSEWAMQGAREVVLRCVRRDEVDKRGPYPVLLSPAELADRLATALDAAVAEERERKARRLAAALEVVEAARAFDRATRNKDDPDDEVGRCMGAEGEESANDLFDALARFDAAGEEES